jgi:hypothetical protein
MRLPLAFRVLLLQILVTSSVLAVPLPFSNADSEIQALAKRPQVTNDPPSEPREAIQDPVERRQDTRDIVDNRGEAQDLVKRPQVTNSPDRKREEIQELVKRPQIANDPVAARGMKSEVQVLAKRPQVTNAEDLVKRPQIANDPPGRTTTDEEIQDSRANVRKL